MARRIAIVHHPRSFFALDLRRAIGEDLQPIWVLAGSGHDRGLTRLLARTGPVLDALGLDATETARRLSEHRPDGIVTFVDDTMPFTAAIAARLGLPYHTEEIAATVVDKQRQRAAFAAAGVPGPRFWTIPADVDGSALASITEEITYPAVLKPCLGSGSLGLRRVSSPGELVGLLERGHGAVVEEYLQDASGVDPHFASYLSLESVVSHGRISHAAICGRFPLAAPFRETGNFIPVPATPELQSELIDITERAIRALSISSSILHTEIKLTDDGPRVIEINGRLGGRPPFVLADVSDVNLFRAACDVALGKTVVYDQLVATAGVGFYWMAQPPGNARAVCEVRGVSELKALAGIDSVCVNRHPGDPVDWREGTAGHVVTVRGRVPDLDALAATIDVVQDTLEIEYETMFSDALDGDTVALR